MSAVYGVNRTLANDPSGGNTIGNGLAFSRVRVMHDTYEASGLTAGSTIDMGATLPTGAKIIGIAYAFDALGSATIDIGDDESTARYVNDLDVSSAASGFSCLVDGMSYEVDMTVSSTPDNQIVITTASDSITGTIKLCIFYSVD